MIGLYVHCPFCASKCHYCDFYSVVDRHELMDAYVDAVILEAGRYRGMGFETLYIGGGTPSLLGARRLGNLVRGLGQVFDLGAVTEATIEVNPESASEEVLETALALGVNRVSIGVQSLSDGELCSAGRIHTAAQAVEAVVRAGRVGFLKVSADLIIGLPGQSWPALRRTLTSLIDLGVRHISTYCLSLEPGTRLAADQPQNLPSEDSQAEFFEKTRSFLAGEGFRHYEISNFAVEGLECLHNLNYWRGGEYVGLGPAAASHLYGRRYRNSEDLKAYLANPGGHLEEVEQLSPARKAAEEAMLRLRLLAEGVEPSQLRSRYGEVDSSRVIRVLEELLNLDLLTKKDLAYCLTPSRVLTSNEIFGSLLY